jgi:outer membrane protein
VNPAGGRKAGHSGAAVATAALVGLAFAAISAQGETLEDAWRIAQEQDLSLAAAESRIAAAEADLGAASAERRPRVAATASLLELDSSPAFDFSAAGLALEMPLLDGSTLKTAAASVTLPVYTSGRTGAGIDAARAGLDVERRAAAALSQQVRLAVAERYIGVLRAESAAAVADSNVASLAAHVREVEDMFQAGSVPRNDYLAASVSLADAEQRRLQAQNTLAVAQASYNRALGRSLDESFELEAELPPVDSRIGRQNVEALTGLALVQREELKRLQAAADALTAHAESASAAAGPQFSLTGGYQWFENEFLTRDDYWMLGIGVEWSLFDGGRARNRAHALSFQSEAFKRQRRDLQSLIALDVRQAWLTRDESERRVTVTERALHQAEENLRVTRDRYRNGEGANSDVLDAEGLRSMSLYNHDAARYDAALARYRLGYAVGLL